MKLNVNLLINIITVEHSKKVSGVWRIYEGVPLRIKSSANRQWCWRDNVDRGLHDLDRLITGHKWHKTEMYETFYTEGLNTTDAARPQ